MQTITKRKWLKASTAVALLLPIALVTGCGGGGGGTPTPNTARVGTYQGTFTFPPQTSDPSKETGLTGTFTLRVQSNGQATGVFNEEESNGVVSTTGTVNLSSGAISLSSADVNNTITISNITVSGNATSSAANGQVVETVTAITSDTTTNASSSTGTFTATKTSNTILPPATAVPGQLVKRRTGKKVGAGA